MSLKDITRSFKRSRLFTTINIIGLSIGLAVAIMLILFVLNEYSYDRHFTDSDRIVSLNTVLINASSGEKRQLSNCTREGLTEIPKTIPGIEAATQMNNIFNDVELSYANEHFQNLKRLYTESNIFDIFDIKILIGSPKSLDEPNTIIMTDKYAKIIFGSVNDAIGKRVSIKKKDFTIGAIVKELPQNTHFSFDILANIKDIQQMLQLDYNTFYKIEKGRSVEDVSRAIEKGYTQSLEKVGKWEGAYGVVEKLTDIYLHTQSGKTLEKKGDSNLLRLLVVISILILSLAITNFVNLYIAQGETRTLEIGIRKTNGARRKNLIIQFFSEIASIVLVSFIIAFILALLILPYFTTLVNKNIDLHLLKTPLVVVSIVLTFLITISLSASYPALYLSRFNVMDILASRLRFTKRKLATVVIVFQSVISISLLAYIVVINSQIAYLKTLPIHYNPKGVMMVNLNDEKHSKAIEQELQQIPEVKETAMSDGIWGTGARGQKIKLSGEEVDKSIREYVVKPGLCEMMEVELVEGNLFQKDDPKNEEYLILNETAVKHLGLTYPVVGKTVIYKGSKPMEIIGVVKDFIYDSPQDQIEPLAIGSYDWMYYTLNIRFDDHISRSHAQSLIENTIKKIDSEFTLKPIWAEDIYNNKFKVHSQQTQILSYSSTLAILISMLGLLAIHFYTVTRRTKEIAIRRISGATGKSLFTTLSTDTFKWILVAGVIAIPMVYYIANNWLNDYANRVSLNIWIFALPIIIQLMIALITTSGITLKVLSRNPVEALKSE